MKTNRLLLMAWLGAVPIAAMGAPAAAPAELGVEVNFFEPEKFTDVKDGYMGSHVRSSYLERLREHVVRQAARFVPPGYSLAITFTELDMAGEFEPWRGPSFSDIRIVKEIYPPYAVLHFRLVDPEGNVVKTGRRELRDTAFMMKSAMGFRDDPLRYEKAMIDDWLHAEFARVAGK